MNFVLLPGPRSDCPGYHRGYGRALPLELRQFVLTRDRRRCRICRRARATTVDHIWPLRYGGTDDPENLQAACLACNTRKRDHLPVGVLPLFSATGGARAELCRVPHMNHQQQRWWLRSMTRRRWCNGGWLPPLVDMGETS